MSSLTTKLYATQGNGGAADVSIAEIGSLIGSGDVPLASPTVPGIVLQAATVAALTDSTGGTASATLAAITAGSSYAEADMVAVKNALASLAADYNALRTSLRAAGIVA